MSTPRAVIYGRVSTAGQKDGTSLETQYVACRKKADEIGATVIGAFEETQSGGDYVSREGMQSALKLIESGEADTLIIYDMSRYSRDAIHQQQILNRVLQAGGTLVFTTFDLGDLRDNPEGRLAFGVQGIFAEYERLKIRSRMMQGRRAQAEKGLQVTHSAPFGYEIATRDKIMAGTYKIEDHKKYFIIESQAVRIRDIFERYAKGQSLYEIARDYNSRGLKAKQGGIWRPSSIRAILCNPTYKGTAHFGKYSTHRDESLLEKGFRSKVRYKTVPLENRVTISVPPIVSPELWEACQVRLKENQSRIGGHSTIKYLLSGVLKCPSCGKKMHGSANRSRRLVAQGIKEPIYTCQAISHWHDKGSRCDGGHWRGTRLEEAVINTIILQLTDIELLQAALVKQESLKSPKPKSGATVIELHKKLKALEKREQATVKAQIAALQKGISSKVYETELQTITSERDALSQTLREIEREKQAPKELKTHAQKLRELSADKMVLLTNKNAPVIERRDLLFELVESIVPKRVGRGVAVEIHWRKPPQIA